MKRTFENVLNTFKKRRTGVNTVQDLQQEEEEMPEFQRKEGKISFFNPLNLNILPKKQKKQTIPTIATARDKRKMTQIQQERNKEVNQSQEQTSFFGSQRDSTQLQSIFSKDSNLFSPNKDNQKSTQKSDFFFSPSKDSSRNDNGFSLNKQGPLTPRGKDQNFFKEITFSGFKDPETFSGFKDTNNNGSSYKENYNNLFSTPIKQTPSFERQLFISPEKENKNINEPFIFGQQKKISEIKNEVRRVSRNSPKRSPREKISYKRKIEEVEIYNPMERPCTLKLSLIKARNLIATERGFKEKSDPFFVLELENQKSISKIVNSTTEPEYGQTFSFVLTPNTLRLKLSVFDHDHVFDHLYLGKVELFLNDAFYQCKSRNSSSDEISGWYSISEGQGEVFLVYRIIEGLDMKF